MILGFAVTIENITKYKWPLLTKGLFSDEEGFSINHHSCSMRIGIVILLCTYMSLDFLKYFNKINIFSFIRTQTSKPLFLTTRAIFKTLVFSEKTSRIFAS